MLSTSVGRVTHAGRLIHITASHAIEVYKISPLAKSKAEVNKLTPFTDCHAAEVYKVTPLTARSTTEVYKVSPLAASRQRQVPRSTK